VTHRNVIRIYDIADADGLKFITMEFVEGDSASQILPDNGKLPPEKAVEIIRQVCSGPRRSSQRRDHPP
jgi:serine/threonine-protein kinase